MQFGQLRRTLDGLNLGVYNIKLARDKRDTVGDERLGLLCHFVLILNGVVVVHRNQRVHNIARAFLVLVGIAYRQNRSHLIDTCNSKALYHTTSLRIYLFDTDVEFYTLEGILVKRGFLDGERHCVIQLDGLAIIGLAFNLSQQPCLNIGF